MKLNGWFWTAVLSLFIIIFQLLFPGPVPDAIMKVLSQNNSAFVGLDATLQVSLILWVVGGFSCFLAGLVGIFISNRSR
ncbi:hypothetical protein ACFLUO_04165 [Chloroflexota bacterium]